MKCSEFNSYIQDFIKDNLPDYKYDEFMEHYHECAECNEELEILYLVHYTINMSESDSMVDDLSFNLKEKLSNHISAVENRVYRRYQHRLFRNGLIFLAEMISFISGLYYIYELLS